MLGNVYRGVGQRSWEEVTDPVITDDADAIVRVSATSICGTDLHILRGDVPSVRPGTVLGHEAVGIVEQVGDGVRTIGEGDRVLVSCVSSCGACRFCREGRFGLCRGGGGWLLGHTCNGTQAEFVQVPFADTSTYHLPVSVTDEEALLLADTIPTGYEVGVLKAGIQPGDVVVVVGSGPVGLAAIMGAKLFSPSHIIAVDHADLRLEAAKQFGADITVNNSVTDPVRIVRALTDGMGADAVIEAVGEPETFELAVRLSRPGAKIANVGVHGKPAALHLEEQWTRDITLTIGQVDTNSIPVLLRLLASKQIDASKFVTHRFGLHEFAEAYDVVTRAGETGALKAVLSADIS
jgi:alcohol dehydrogenase